MELDTRLYINLHKLCVATNMSSLFQYVDRTLSYSGLLIWPMSLFWDRDQQTNMRNLGSLQGHASPNDGNNLVCCTSLSH